MQQGIQTGGLCFGSSSVFLKKLGGGKQLTLWGDFDGEEGSQGEHLNTRSLVCEDFLTYMYNKHHQVV